MASLWIFNPEFRNKLEKNVISELCFLYMIEGVQRSQMLSDNGIEITMTQLSNLGKINSIESLFNFRDELQIGASVIGWKELKSLSDFITGFLVSINY